MTETYGRVTKRMRENSWLGGLVAWFSLRVREVRGSIPRRALVFLDFHFYFFVWNSVLLAQKYPFWIVPKYHLPFSTVVSIPGFHPGDPGSNPGGGILFDCFQISELFFLIFSHFWIFNLAKFCDKRRKSKNILEWTKSTRGGDRTRNLRRREPTRFHCATRAYLVSQDLRLWRRFGNV